MCVVVPYDLDKGAAALHLRVVLVLPLAPLILPPRSSAEARRVYLSFTETRLWRICAGGHRPSPRGSVPLNE
jgi:hypothetical protein